MRGIVVCVNYDDLLEITLPRNVRHMDEIVVVTHPSDLRTIDLVRSVHGARLFTTDAFYRHGAKFNKGLALEEGFDALGREGWILVHDADMLLPDEMILPPLTVGRLYGARRVCLDDPRQWHPGFDWSRARWQRDQVPVAGYFQLFHADDPHVEKRPWYDVTFAHAGGGDGYFQSRWSPSEITHLQFRVLHLGPRDMNWFGRVSPRRDGHEVPGDQGSMNRYKLFKGWLGVRALPDFQERVDVPGHEPTGFET